MLKAVTPMFLWNIISNGLIKEYAKVASYSFKHRGLKCTQNALESATFSTVLPPAQKGERFAVGSTVMPASLPRKYICYWYKGAWSKAIRIFSSRNPHQREVGWPGQVSRLIRGRAQMRMRVGGLHVSNHGIQGKNCPTRDQTVGSIAGRLGAQVL